MLQRQIDAIETLEQHLARLALQLKRINMGARAHLASLEIHIDLTRLRIGRNELGKLRH
jgi:hypothetical protein